MSNNFNHFSSEEFYKQKLTSFVSEGSAIFDFYSIFSDDECEDGNKTYSVGLEDEFPSLTRVDLPAELEDSIEQLDHYFTDSLANDNSESNSEEPPWLSKRTSSLLSSVKSMGTLPLQKQASDRNSIQIENNLPTDSTFSMDISDFNSNSAIESYNSFSKKKINTNTNTNTDTNTNGNTNTNTNTNTNRNTNTEQNTNTETQINNNKNQNENTNYYKKNQNKNEKKGISVLQLQNSFVGFDLNLFQKKVQNPKQKIPNLNFDKNDQKKQQITKYPQLKRTSKELKTNIKSNVDTNNQGSIKTKRENSINSQFEHDVKPSEILEIFIKKKKINYNSSLKQENKPENSNQNSSQFQTTNNRHPITHTRRGGQSKTITATKKKKKKNKTKTKRKRNWKSSRSNSSSHSDSESKFTPALHTNNTATTNKSNNNNNINLAKSQMNRFSTKELKKHSSPSTTTNQKTKRRQNLLRQKTKLKSKSKIKTNKFQTKDVDWQRKTWRFVFGRKKGIKILKKKRKKRNKRLNTPKHAKSIFEKWFLEHLNDPQGPYMDKKTRTRLSQTTSIPELQVQRWFGQRRRSQRLRWLKGEAPKPNWI
ncbi:homeobox protein meis2 [Anaeramoeba flamelloides]|uniref:Homeobox protein meis2 n=1 Tax=Anaeramoeba flamelloides TaxID=1746091 RepID=A0ABQ8Z8P7_9EUKA|nr:homeobox protein meis2 [Anaeramoeba flamelloides]